MELRFGACRSLRNSSPLSHPQGGCSTAGSVCLQTSLWVPGTRFTFICEAGPGVLAPEGPKVARRRSSSLQRWRFIWETKGLLRSLPLPVLTCAVCLPAAERLNYSLRNVVPVNLGRGRPVSARCVRHIPAPGALSGRGRGWGLAVPPGARPRRCFFFRLSSFLTCCLCNCWLFVR